VLKRPLNFGPGNDPGREARDPACGFHAPHRSNIQYLGNWIVMAPHLHHQPPVPEGPEQSPRLRFVNHEHRPPLERDHPKPCPAGPRRSRRHPGARRPRQTWSRRRDCHTDGVLHPTLDPLRPPTWGQPLQVQNPLQELHNAHAPEGGWHPELDGETPPPTHASKVRGRVRPRVAGIQTVIGIGHCHLAGNGRHVDRTRPDSAGPTSRRAPSRNRSDHLLTCRTVRRLRGKLPLEI